VNLHPAQVLLRGDDREETDSFCESPSSISVEGDAELTPIEAKAFVAPRLM
jgi:hypothetical protein